MYSYANDDKENADPLSEIADAAKPAPAPMDPMVQQHLLSLAQDKAGTNQLYAGLARAGGTLANALAGNRGPMDESGFNALDKAADAPVQDAINQQKGAASALQQQKLIDDSDAQADMNDPESDVSKNAQIAYKANFPGKLSDEELSGMSANDLEAQQKTALGSANLAEKAAGIAQRSQDHQDSLDKKSTDDQNNNYTKMRKDLESFRGNQAAQQAAVKVQNADTALAIVKNKDPNSLTTQDLTLLAEEMGKIASGGVPTEHGTQALMPNNLQTKFAEMKNFLLSKPTDAQAGDYIKHNMEYLEQMKDVAKGTLNSYRTNISKGYKAKVSADQYQEAMDDYQLNPRAPNASAPAAPAPSAPAAPVVSQDKIAAQIAKRQKSGSHFWSNWFANGGMVGGLPASNFSAEQMQHVQKPPALHLQAPHKFADGGTVQASKPEPTIDEKIRQYFGMPTGSGSGTFRNYQQGGVIPGKPKVNHDSYVNDTEEIMASPGEVMLPLHVTQAKDPALASYIYMKHLASKGK